MHFFKLYHLFYTNIFYNQYNDLEVYEYANFNDKFLNIKMIKYNIY